MVDPDLETAVDRIAPHTLERAGRFEDRRVEFERYARRDQRRYALSRAGYRIACAVGIAASAVAAGTISAATLVSMYSPKSEHEAAALASVALVSAISAGVAIGHATTTHPNQQELERRRDLSAEQVAYHEASNPQLRALSDRMRAPYAHVRDRI